MSDSINKIEIYKSNLKKYQNMYNELEKKKLVIETNIENKTKAKEEILNKIIEAGFDPNTLDEDIKALENEIDNITKSIENLFTN